MISGFDVFTDQLDLYNVNDMDIRSRLESKKSRKQMLLFKYKLDDVLPIINPENYYPNGDDVNLINYLFTGYTDGLDLVNILRRIILITLDDESMWINHAQPRLLLEELSYKSVYERSCVYINADIPSDLLYNKFREYLEMVRDIIVLDVCCNNHDPRDNLISVEHDGLINNRELYNGTHYMAQPYYVKDIHLNLRNNTGYIYINVLMPDERNDDEDI